MKTRFSAFLLFVLMAVEMNAQNYTYQYEGQPITLTAVDPIQLFARGGDRDQNITDTEQVTRSVALSEKLWMMIDQGLAPLSVIYRTFGAFSLHHQSKYLMSLVTTVYNLTIITLFYK